MSGVQSPPHRVVDREQRSWMLTAGPGGIDRYTADMHQTFLSLDEVRAQHGPVRPVLPVTPEDVRLLEDALGDAGRKAVYSLSAAVYRTLSQVRADHGGMDPAPSSRPSCRCASCAPDVPARGRRNA